VLFLKGSYVMFIVKLYEAMLDYEHRTGARMTHALLSRRTEIAVDMLSAIARNPGDNATLNAVSVICRALGVEMKSMVEVEPAAERANQALSSLLALLSPRERQILDLLAQGKVPKEIGAILRLRPATVRIHHARIRAKLGLRNDMELGRWLTESKYGASRSLS
jgi:DNA-binding CsgD family transcriptional regulator/DNA-binding Xre family transcriptional regulator